MRKPVVFFLLILFPLLLSFQNCSPSRLETNPEFTNPPNSKTEEVVSDAQDVLKNASAVEIPSRHLVGLNNGEIYLNSQRVGCLNQQQLQQIQNIISSADLCEMQSKAEDTMCAMIYAMPYAKLHHGQDVLPLGEKTSSCSGGPDLCGDAKLKLRAWITDLNPQLLQINLSSCSQ